MSEIKHIIYHVLEKEQGSESIIRLNPNEQPINDTTGILLNQITERYRGRAGKGYGSFKDEPDVYTMPSILSDYFVTGEENFYQTTTRMMKVLKSWADKEQFATGGNVVISHYTNENIDYLLVAIINEKIGLKVSEWNVEQDDFLDIDNLKFAGRINLTAWINKEERYISFLKGQGNVANYFKHFLGCDDILLAQKETAKLILLLEEFAGEQDLSPEERTNFLQDTYNYLLDLNKQQEHFELEPFANRVWPINPQALKDKLSDDEEKGVSDGFTPDARSLRPLIKFSAKTKNWSISFNREALSSNQVCYDNGVIVIYDLPQDLINKLEKETKA